MMLPRGVFAPGPLQAILIAGWLLCVPAQTAELADPPAAQPLRFVRYYVPADSPREWPIDSGRYVPVEGEEFERLVKLARSVPAGALSAPAASLDQATYEARLDGDLLTGTAIYDLTHPSDAEALVPLDPFGLAIEDAQWQQPEAAPATLGTQATGKLVVLVERPGRLVVNWVLRGRRDDASGAVSFALAIPRCLMGTLWLDLPPELAPSCPAAIVTDESATDSGQRRWRIELGAQHQVDLRIRPREAASDPGRLPIVQEKVDYEISRQGLDVKARWTFDVQHQPLARLEVALDRGLQLVSARYGELDVPWSVVEAGEPTRVMLEFPEPIQGSGRIVQLTALAGLTTDHTWRLPSLRPRGVFWQEGTATLLVQAPLVLEKLIPWECRQLHFGHLAAPLQGEFVELQSYSAEASADVIIGRQEPRIELASGTLIKLGRREAAGQFVGRVRLARGSAQVLAAEVTGRWIIESVTTRPPASQPVWAVDDSHSGGRVLTVRLERALAPDAPVTLVVNGRLPSGSAGQSVRLADLELLVFRDAWPTQRLLSVGASEPHSVRIDGGTELARLDPGQMAPEQRELFEQPPAQWVWDIQAGVGPAEASLEEILPRYTARVRVDADLYERRILETYTLGCRPDRSRVERVIVHLSQPRTEALQWSRHSDAAGPLAARRWSVDEQTAAGLGSKGETWEVSLTRPSADDFELRASRSSEWVDGLPVSLASLPGATEQQGTVLIRAEHVTPAIAADDSLRPILPDPVAGSRYNTVRAAFRYDPADQLEDKPAAVRVGRAKDGQEQAGAFAWSGQLDSRYEATGRGLHLATFRLQCDGRARCGLTLPGGAEALGIWVDEARLAPPLGSDLIDVPLPSGQKFVTLIAEFRTVGRPLGIMGSCNAPWPQLDIPVLARDWTLWVPSDYELLDGEAAGGSMQLTWPQRLFGPLGRPAEEAPFDPVSAKDWQRLAGRSSSLEAAQALANDLVRQLGARPRGRTLTWARILADAQRAMRMSTDGIWVDAPALAEAGVGPATRLAADEADIQNPRARGWRTLKQAGLALVARADGLIITTAAAAARERSRLVAIDPGAFFWTPGGVFGHSGRAPDAGRPERWIRLSSWLADAGLPWTPRYGSDMHGLDQVGWSAYRFHTLGEPSWQPRVVRRAVVLAAGWTALGLALAIGRWWLRERMGWLLLAAGAFAVAAMLVPAAWTSVASGALIGTLVCLVVAICRPGQRLTAPEPTYRSSIKARLAAAAPSLVWLTLGAAAACSAAVWADDGPGEQAVAPADEIHRILIPVDGEGKPDGSRYQVPASFLDELRRQEAEATLKASGWILRGASYRARLSRGPAESDLAIDHLIAHYEVQVFTSNTPVRIPLLREDAELVPDLAMLDGRAVELAWDDEGRAILCDIHEPGIHQLELTLDPSADASGAGSLEMAIPPVAGATLELQAPSFVTGIEVPGAAGEVARSEEQGHLLVGLGPVTQLQIRWPPGAVAAGPRVDVDELLWLKIGLGSVVLEATFKYKITSGEVQRLEWAADPRMLQPLPEGLNSPIAQVRTLPGAVNLLGRPQVFQVDLNRPASDQLVLHQSFRMTKTSGVGDLRLPLLQTLGARRVRRRLAVWVDKRLEYEVHGDADLQVLGLDDFVNEWGLPVADRPLLAYELPINESAWSIATRPPKPQTTATQSLAVSCQPSAATVRFDADIKTTGGHIFQHRLSAPRDLEIESISLQAQGAERAERWARDGTGAITLFLAEPVTGSQKLSLAGRLPTSSNGAFPLPALDVETDQPAESTVQVFRQPAVLVSLDALAGLTEASGADERHSNLGRLVAQWSAAGEFSATVTVRPNAPAIKAEQVTVMRFDRGWEAEVVCRLDIKEGVLDQLRFDIPAEWPGPFEVTPPAPTELVESTGDGRRQLTVRPRQAITGTYRISLRGPFDFRAGQAVPDVWPLEAQTRRQWLVLPLQTGSDPVTWDTAGFQPARLPAGFALESLASQAAKVYQPASERPRAMPKLALPQPNVPQVRLADICLAWQSDGESRMVAAFDLEPAGLRHCPLRLPEGWRALQIMVGGRSVVAELDADGVRQVPLGAERLPQRIEVVLAGRLAQELVPWGRQRLPAPALGNLPVERTLWTICSPEGFQVIQPGDNAALISPLRYELFRTRSSAELLNLPADVILLTPADELSVWFGDWARRAIGSRRMLDKRLLSASRANRVESGVQSEVGEIQAQFAAAGRGLNKTRDGGATPAAAADYLGLLKQLEAQRLSGGETTDLWQRACAAQGSVARLLVQRGTGGPEISYFQGPERERLPRIALAAAIGLGAVLAAWFCRRKSAATLSRWPRLELLGVLAGVAWWLWLIPSVLGLAIVSASLISAIRSGWFGPRDSASSVSRAAPAQPEPP